MKEVQVRKELEVKGVEAWRVTLRILKNMGDVLLLQYDPLLQHPDYSCALHFSCRGRLILAQPSAWPEDSPPPWFLSLNSEDGNVWTPPRSPREWLRLSHATREANLAQVQQILTDLLKKGVVGLREDAGLENLRYSTPRVSIALCPIEQGMSCSGEPRFALDYHEAYLEITLWPPNPAVRKEVATRLHSVMIEESRGHGVPVTGRWYFLD